MHHHIKGRNSFIRGLAIEIGTIGGHEYWIVPKPQLIDSIKILRKIFEDPDIIKAIEHLEELASGYNGYVVFKEKPSCEPGCGGLLKYVPVHGGITYHQQDEVGCVYGFDTNHIFSGQRSINNPAYIRRQCRIMIRGLKKVAQLEIKYITAKTKEERRDIAQEVWDVAHGEEVNLGMMIDSFLDEVE